MACKSFVDIFIFALVQLFAYFIVLTITLCAGYMRFLYQLVCLLSLLIKGTRLCSGCMSAERMKVAATGQDMDRIPRER